MAAFASARVIGEAGSLWPCRSCSCYRLLALAGPYPPLDERIADARSPSPSPRWPIRSFRTGWIVRPSPEPALLLAAVQIWTKKNFEQLSDVSPPDVPMQWRFAREALSSPEIGVSRFTYEPGARMPWGHRHRAQEEVYVVVSGTGRANLDGELVDLAAWDVLRVAPSVTRHDLGELHRVGELTEAHSLAGLTRPAARLCG